MWIVHIDHIQVHVGQDFVPGSYFNFQGSMIQLQCILCPHYLKNDFLTFSDFIGYLSNDRC